MTATPNTPGPGRIYAEVIGDPIVQSKSPIIHNHWLTLAGIDAEYRACHVSEAAIGDYIARRRTDPHWRGCNVTLPHKLAIIDHVADPGAVADSIGAMNTVARDSFGTLFGTNTDAAGFWAPIADYDVNGRDVVVIGAGGAARAVLFALKQVGCGSVTILNRNVLKASALLARFGLKGQALPLEARLPPAALLVNASALGMRGQPPLTIDLDPLPDDALVYDLVYAPLETPLLAAARAAGRDCVGGLDMLVGQAAIAFELFFGVAPDRRQDDALYDRLTA
jgi:shikimate dehydrogenase